MDEVKIPVILGLAGSGDHIYSGPLIRIIEALQKKYGHTPVRIVAVEGCGMTESAKSAAEKTDSECKVIEGKETDIVRHIHVLVICHDREIPPETELGKLLERMRDEDFSEEEDLLFDPQSGYVLQIRGNGELFFYSQSGTERLGGFDIPVQEFTCIEKYNKDVDRYAKKILRIALEPGLQVGGAEREQIRKAYRIYQSSRGLADLYRDRRLRTILLLTIIYVALVLFFLFYGELESPLMLAFYGALILLAAVIYRRARSRDYHGKALLYRLLSEAVHVQYNMILAGVSDYSFYVPYWQQTAELRFIEKSLRMFGTIDAPTSKPGLIKEIDKNWIQGQMDYHGESYANRKKQIARNKSWSRGVMLAAVAVYAAIVLIEAAFPQIMDTKIPNIFHFIFPFTDTTTTWYNMCGIIFGSVSAAAVFTSYYYNKLDLRNEMRDNGKMYRLYERAHGKLAENPDIRMSGKILLVLANSTIQEVVKWYLFNLDDAPKLEIAS